jgi:hypothetical protein
MARKVIPETGFRLPDDDSEIPDLLDHVRIDGMLFSDKLAGLRDAMLQWSGSLVNPFPGLDPSDFDFRFFRQYSTEAIARYTCVFRSRSTGRYLNSDPLLWAGPRSDYWVITGELVALAKE